MNYLDEFRSPKRSSHNVIVKILISRSKDCAQLPSFAQNFIEGPLLKASYSSLPSALPYLHHKYKRESPENLQSRKFFFSLSPQTVVSITIPPPLSPLSLSFPFSLQVFQWRDEDQY
jgi:hypothetical protein